MIEDRQNRELIVSDLVGTMLGPKYGLRETFHATMNPKKIYLTGVLAPVNSEPDEDSENQTSETPLYEENDIDTTTISDPEEFIPSLSSASQPESFGISFTISSAEKCGKIDCCFTWARYIWFSNWDEIPKEYDEHEKLIGWYDKDFIEEITKRVQDEIRKGKIEKMATELNKNNQNDAGKENSINMGKKKGDSYIEENESESPNLTNVVYGGWKRDPRYLIIKGLKICPEYDKTIINKDDLKENKVFESINYQFPTVSEFFHVYLRIRKKDTQKKDSKNYFNVSIYFVNDYKRIRNTDFPEPERKSNIGKPTEAFVFQPQIRVKCIKDTEIVSDYLNYDESKIYDYQENLTESEKMKDDFEKILDDNKCITDEKPTEDKILEFIYLKKHQKAKGHMCAAIWSDIDPEKRYKKIDPIRSPPFFWVDGELLNDFERNYFYLPDIRTEFVPIIPISAPNFNWRRKLTYANGNIEYEELKGENRDGTFLDPLFLAENCWDRHVLKKTFQELIDEYINWMRIQCQIIQNTEIFKINLELKKIAKYNLKNHIEIYKRIRKGLNILDMNADARLSFCFANKVIYLQNYWINKRKPIPEKFYWRPFQITFLIISISSIINKEDIDRNLLDLIWFPTGGGKTEAYLLVAAFTLAYRRRIAYKDLEKLPYIENGTYLISRYTLRLLTIQQFRRANLMTLAADYLRVKNLLNNLESFIIGWLPEIFKDFKDPNVKEQFGYLLKCHKWIWGTHRFSVGLWVGSKMTPNRLEMTWAYGRPYYGALDALKVKIDTTITASDISNVEEIDIDQDTPILSEPEDQSENNDQLLRSAQKITSNMFRNIVKDVGDPAQIVKCPVCDALLTLPKSNDQFLPNEINNFYLLIKVKDTKSIPDSRVLKNKIEAVIERTRNLFPFETNILNVFDWKSPNIYSINFYFKAKEDKSYTSEKIADWWLSISKEISKLEIICTDIRNPGYYYLYYHNKPYDFEIRCGNPKCDLNKVQWAEGTNIPNKNTYWTENTIQWVKNNPNIALSIPISAYTVDDQVYRRLPSLVIGTVDKFAQLVFKDEAGAIFGHVEYCSPKFGFFKENVVPRITGEKIEELFETGVIDPPEIILQDELHLIVGPLGSMVGIYETIVEELCKRKIGTKIIRSKYIASTATIKAGEQQAKCLYNRKLSIFPPYGIDETDSFFLINQKLHPLEENIPGRLYIGMCCPGKSVQTPLSHIWGSLFQKPYEIMRKIKDNLVLTLEEKNKLLENLDPYWTIVGYFNAIRELAGVRAIYTQEFVAWMRLFYGKDNFRQFHLRIDEPIELSSRTDSVALPEYFEKLEKHLKLINTTIGNQLKINEPVNGVLTTSMFGTGVDVLRLGIMVVNGQPKTTASYIQATGRIGRKIGGISVALLRAGRPRDLDHYEQFSGYHTAIYKFVEPITVMPFSLNCMKIAFGPLAVALLRQATSLKDLNISKEWRRKEVGNYNILNLNSNIGTSSVNPVPRKSKEFEEITKIFKERFDIQHIDRKPKIKHFDNAINYFYEKAEKWQELAKLINKSSKSFAYNEATLDTPPRKSVVLGDPQHQVAASKPKNPRLAEPIINIVFQNAPNSLRGVEATTTFGIFADFIKTKDKIKNKKEKRKIAVKKSGKSSKKEPIKSGTSIKKKRPLPQGVIRKR